ncbi:probable Rho3 - GTP binding protein [Ustilago trichophora]|uniref:Probable Rho3 - GTP binding protein n=1 Tax=Ustilago trichophora TaxID=86804 RepID=A0A5C3EG07_9BASI|nr:probable Rho3 - GTP binding protein [Ustilago trichophora]
MTLCGLLASNSDHNGTKGARLARKVLVLGDGACGKTSMLFVLIKHEFPQAYEPTVFENYVHIMQPSAPNGPSVELTLWDTAGQEEFDKLRSLSYADTHVVVLCFSVDNPVSLENVETRWMPEIRDHCPGVKIVLVALKCDLRDTKTPRLTYNDGVEVAKRIRASRYLECSAKMNRGVNEAFVEIANVAMGSRAKALMDKVSGALWDPEWSLATAENPSSSMRP